MCNLLDLCRNYEVYSTKISIDIFCFGCYAIDAYFAGYCIAARYITNDMDLKSLPGRRK